MWTLPEKPTNLYGEGAELKKGSVPAWTCCSCSATHSDFNAPLACPLCSHKRDAQCQKSAREIEWYTPLATQANQFGSVREPAPLITTQVAPSVFTQGDEEPSDEYIPTQEIFDLARFELQHEPKPLDVKSNTELYHVMTGEEARGLVEMLRQKRWHRLVNKEQYTPDEMKLDDLRTIGFVPEELMKAGILEEKGVKSNNLTRDIHPLFAYDHWYNTPKEIYDAWAPA